MTPKVGIIGGGFTGAAVAVRLSRASAEPLDIVIVEPSAELGRGVAYGTKDPDHRINGPTLTHSLYPDDVEHFDRWCRANGVLADDPECLDIAGRAFVRRTAMGRYVGSELAAHQADNPSGSTISHIQDRAVNARTDGAGFTVSLADNDDLPVDLLVVTTSNAPPALLPPLQGAVAGHQSFYPDPWDSERLAQIAADARVLIVGTGLTMADVAIVVGRDRPAAKITAISRRGLLPKSQRRVPSKDSFAEVLGRAVPAFVARHGRPSSVCAMLRAVRSDASNNLASGGEWQAAFDDIRDAAHQLWPALSEQEQSRFLRHLAPWYETHRFRYPPQVDAKIQAMMASGQLTTRAAALVSA
ncbi:MAG: NAD(P)-binding protein, partial [Alphaproteobacteria bacterium]|nr:NAD(P)-binding protein [Alphaproteobacteria bacterium]